MTMSRPAVIDLIEARKSVTRYQAGRDIDEATVTELVRLATLAPSAYHLQNWRFIAVRSAAARLRLQALAFGQPQVGEAALTFIVCGRLAAYRGLAAALAPSREAGLMPAELLERWVEQASQAHESDPQLQRDEAVRSASLAGMTLMLAAQGLGLASGPLGGFDAAGVAREFGLAPEELPVLLITVGHARADNWPQKPRKPLAQVLSYA